MSTMVSEVKNHFYHHATIMPTVVHAVVYKEHSVNKKDTLKYNLTFATRCVIIFIYQEDKMTTEQKEFFNTIFQTMELGDFGKARELWFEGQVHFTIAPNFNAMDFIASWKEPMVFKAGNKEIKGSMRTIVFPILFPLKGEIT